MQMTGRNLNLLCYSLAACPMPWTTDVHSSWRRLLINIGVCGFACFIYIYIYIL